MFEHVGVARFPTYFGKIRTPAQARRVRAQPRHHPQRAATAQRRWAAASATSSSDYVFPGGELTHVARVIEAMSRGGTRARRRRGAARALRQDAVALDRSARGERRCSAARGRRGTLPDLAHLHGRLGARVRSRVAVAVAAARRRRPHDDGRLPHPLTREYIYRARRRRAGAAGPASAAPCCKPPGAPPSWQDAPLPHRHDHDARRIRAHLSDGLPDQDHGPPRRRLRPDRWSTSCCSTRRTSTRPAVEMRSSREGNYLSLTVTINGHLARAARRALSRAHVAPDGRDGALGICVPHVPHVAREPRMHRSPAARPPGRLSGPASASDAERA